MPNLKDIKTRIGSVKKTKQITSAMKLVAAAKLKRATDAAVSARPYQRQLAAVLQRVASSAGEVDLPLLEAREHVRKAWVVVITSDRGLCGGFNNTLLRQSIPWMNDQRARGLELAVKVYGRKGRGFYARRGFTEQEAVTNWAALPKGSMVQELADHLVSGFIDGATDEVWVISNEFVNNLTQKPRYFKLLPLSVSSGAAATGAEYRYEPGAQEILEALLPLYVRNLLLQAFLETEAGEHASRMTAMDSAKRNAGDLIDSLTLQYNRARQAAITKELIEIVSGAQALE